MLQENSGIVLCADSESLLHPELLGLDGENLGALQWLHVVSDARKAREAVSSQKLPLEVWVAGSDQMDAINLAAALRRDCPDLQIFLIDFKPTGSLASRVKAAGLNGVLDRTAFSGRYRLAKNGASSSLPAGNRSDSRHLGSKGSSHQGAAGGCPAPQPFPPDASRAGFPGLGRADANGSSLPGIPQASLMPSGMPLPQSDAGFTGEGGLGARPGGVAANSLAGGASPFNGCYVLTVAGAGGGTGKSSIASLCACQASRMGKRTLLLDADLQFGDLAFLMGCDKPLRSDELAESPLRIEGLTAQDGMPALLASPLRLERSEFVAARFKGLIELLRPRYEVIVVNTGASWSDVHMQLLEASTNTLFLLDQRPSSIRACRHALELCSSCGIASQPFLFAMNRCSRKALFSGADASTALQGVRVFEFLDGGITVEEQLGCGNPMALFDGRNALAQSVEAFMCEVVPRTRKDAELVFPPEPRRRRWGFKGRRGR